ncbi:MAG: hypothetical protein RSH24_01465 [Flavobacterium sp.]
MTGFRFYYDGKIYNGLQDLSDDLKIKYQTLYAMISGRNSNKLNIRYV